MGLESTIPEDLMGKISVIIRNKNEERWIGHAIQSCLDFFDDPEIIIVDNESADASMQIVNEFCFSNIKTFQIKCYTPGKALNYGVSKASNDIILILSAHSEIQKMIPLEEIKEYLRDNVAMFGKQTPVYRGRKISKRYVWSHFVDEPGFNMWSESEKRNFLHNAFCFYRKDVLLENPFDEKYPAKEERYWAATMAKKGETYMYNPEIECKHHWTPSGATWKGIG